MPELKTEEAKPRERARLVAICKFIAMWGAPLIAAVATPLLISAYTSRVTSSQVSFGYGCQQLDRETSVLVNRIKSIEEKLPTFHCENNQSFPEVYNAELYVDYLSNYTALWISNVTQALDVYQASVDLWAEEIGSSLSALHADLKGINSQISRLSVTRLAILQGIDKVIRPLNELSRALRAVNGRIKYSVSKKVLGVRVKFRVHIPFDICDVASPLCKVEINLDDLVSELLAVGDALNELNLILIPSMNLPPLPTPPALPILPKYDPDSYSTLALPERHSLGVTDIGGITFYTTDVSLPDVNLLQVLIPGGILSLMLSLRLLIHYGLNRHSFYSLRSSLLKAASKDKVIIKALAVSLGEFVAICMVALIAVSFIIDTTCNSCRLYDYGVLSLRMSDLSDHIEESYNACVNCIGNSSFCESSVPIEDVEAKLSSCGELNRGLVDSFEISGSLMFILIYPMMGGFILKNILQLYSIYRSDSPRRLSDRMKLEWINSMVLFITRIKIGALVLKLAILFLPLAGLSSYPVGLLAFFVVLLDRNL